MTTLSKAASVVVWQGPSGFRRLIGYLIQRLMANPITRRMVYVGGMLATIKFAMGIIRGTPAGQHWLRFAQSKIQEHFLVRLNPGARRAIQSAMTVPNSHVRPGHPHPTEAALRNSATKAMEVVASATGREQWVLSPAAREHDIPGERLYYQLNDFSQAVRTAPMGKQTMITMTDIDYYAHMPDWLHFGYPILAYTMVPETAGDSTADGMFTLTDNWVNCTVSGGGNYKHRLWDYHSDSAWSSSPGLIFTSDWRTDAKFVLCTALKALGLIEAFSVTLFSIDHFRFGPHRRVISLVPYAQLPVVLFSLDDYGDKLERMDLRVDGTSGKHYHHLRTLRQGDEPLISVASAGEVTSATVPESVFRSVRTRMAHSKSKLLSDVVATCRDKLGSDRCTVLYDYMLDVEPSSIPTVHYPGDPADHYTVVIKGGTSHLDDQKTYARRFASSPLTSETVYPHENRDNDASCIEKRVNAPQREAYLRIQTNNPYGRNTPPPRFQTYAVEFLKACIPEVGIGTPIEIDDVAEKQNTPAQRARTALVKMHWDYGMIVKSFQKREAYSAVNDPRNISSVPTSHTLRLSAFTYGCKNQVLKQQEWYMPVKTPSQIAQTLHELAQESDFVVEGDYSRFDGTITEWLRNYVERAFYLRWAKEEYHEEIMTLFRREMTTRGVTKQGIWYDPGSSRLSGSPLTTDGNTIINAFVAFCAARDAGIEASVAKAKCGVFYGDDSLVCGSLFGSSDAAVSTLCRVSACLGLNLKAVAVATTKPVMFLSRCFPDLRHSPVSFCDPMRALLKVHTTINTTRDIVTCGVEKTSAYLVTDSRTPLVGDWCKTYLRCIKRQQVDDFEDAAKDVSWWAVDAFNRVEPWPQEGVEDYTGLVAEMLGVDPNELGDHCKLLADYCGDVMGIPALEVAPQVAKVVAVVGGKETDPTGICTIVETPYDYYNLGKKSSNNDINNKTNRGQSDHRSTPGGDHGQSGHDGGQTGVSNRQLQADDTGSTACGSVDAQLNSRARESWGAPDKPWAGRGRQSVGGHGKTPGKSMPQLSSLRRGGRGRSRGACRN